jgi:hypothetical protein
MARARLALALLLVACGGGGGGGGDDGTASDAAPRFDAEIRDCTVLPDNTGCPEGDACELDPDQGTYCRAAVAGTDGSTLCEHRSDCDVGWTCVAGDGPARCVRYCDDATDCPDGACRRDIGNGLHGCTTPCALTDAVGCPTGFSCHSTDGDFSECFLAGATAVGDPCVNQTDCVLGSTCVAPDHGGGASRCRSYCRITPPEVACTTGTCTYLVTVATIDYGVCL